jgi:hypothetical protein
VYVFTNKVSKSIMSLSRCKILMEQQDVPNDAAGAASDWADGRDVLGGDLEEVAVDVVLHVAAAVGVRALDLRLSAVAHPQAPSDAGSAFHAHRPPSRRHPPVSREKKGHRRRRRRASKAIEEGKGRGWRGWLRGGREGGDKGERWGKWKRRELSLAGKSNSRDKRSRSWLLLMALHLSSGCAAPRDLSSSCLWVFYVRLHHVLVVTLPEICG